MLYVPSWQRLSYLSELLVRSYFPSQFLRDCILIVLSLFQQASIVDISHLFEDGAVVDFEIEELVKLVK